MTFDNSEYNSLRAELIHHDRTCLTIIGLLLAASTAIYRLVALEDAYYLLIMLSVLWFVGFLYVVEKRSNIKRISFYIQTKIEPGNCDFNWEAWCRNNRYNKITDDFYLPTNSPLKLEFTLLIMTYIVNWSWFYFWKYDKSQTFLAESNVILFAKILMTILSILFLIYSLIKTIKYYKFNKVYQENTSVE